MANFAQAEPGRLDRNDFKAKLADALRKAVPTPKSPDEAQATMRGGAQNASGALQGELQGQSAQAAGPIAHAANPAAEANPASMPAPPASPLTPEAAGEAPAPVAPDSVAPAPLPPERLDYSADRAETTQLMAENKVTPAQLEQSNEPAFSSALQAQQGAAAREAEMPAEFRAGEAGVRDQTRAAAGQALAQGLAGMHGTRTARVGAVAAAQLSTRDANAAKRTQITQDLNRIKTETRTAVQGILDGMQKSAETMFSAGLARAERAYQNTFDESKGGVLTWLTTWGDDWDALVERSFRAARAAYDAEVSATIDAVATYVEGRLAEAKQRVQQGRAEVDHLVAGLDADVAQFGRDAAAQIGSDLDALTGEIDQRRASLVDSLAQKYAESRERISATEQKLREENKSLWQRVREATLGVINTIIEFKNMLLGVLARAADVVEAIISNPIGFLGNLIAGIRAGLDQFVGNIGEHLKKGLMGWLFGALEGAGIQLPDSFDLKGILSIVLQVLGLTYANIRSRAVRLLGEETVSRLEQVAEVFKILVTEGPAGLWRMLVEKLGNIKDTLLEQIRNWVIEKVIKAGILWVVSLLNPASAFVKACKAIYDIVMFFIERGKQILDLVNAVLDTLSAIVTGNIAAMAAKVENALARMIPVAISFLASLLGLGGISEKIREIIETIQKPVNAAIDWVIGKAVALAKAAGNLFKGGKKSKDKVEKEPADPVKQTKIDAAMLDLDTAEKAAAASGKDVSHEEALALAADVKKRHPVIQGIRVVQGEGVWRYFYRASPEEEHAGHQPAAAQRPTELQGQPTPSLDKLEAIPDYHRISVRYVAEYASYKTGGGEWLLLRYVEHRAATKLGKVTEKPGIAAYNEKTGRGVSKNSKAIEILKGDPPNYVVDRVRVPDFFTPGDVVGDVKNVFEQSYDLQMRDDVRIAKADKVRYVGATDLLNKESKFDLVARAPTHDNARGTNVSKPLETAITDTLGGIYKVI